MRKILLISLFLVLLASFAAATTYTVTNCNDSGEGSLRQAITDANNHPGSDNIIFAIPATDSGYQTAGGVSWWRIRPTSALPTLTNNGTDIDGATQAININNTNPNGPEIEIDGTNAGAYAAGFDLAAANCTVEGLVINRFFTNGVYLSPAGSNNHIIGNYIGTDVNGAADLGNTGQGVEVGGSSFNLIQGNVISGNGGHGIALISASTTASSNEVRGNYIGTDRTGSVLLGNDYSGISLVNGASNNIIANNVISGNYYGINNANAHYTDIIGNYIGTDLNGTADLGNELYGIAITNGSQYCAVGGASVAERNIISGNDSDGIWFADAGTNSNEVEGNYIGTDVNVADLKNSGRGIRITGSSTVVGPSFNIIGPDNAIAFNGSNGIEVNGVGSNNCYSNRITRNHIFSNSGLGISITNGANQGVIPPVISDATCINPQLDLIRVTGTATPLARVEVFKTQSPPDPSGAGEAPTFLGSTDAGLSGNWTLDFSTSPEGSVCATATDNLNNTSEFSQNVTIATSSTTTTTTTQPGTTTTTVPGITTTTSTTTTTISAPFVSGITPNGGRQGRSSLDVLIILENANLSGDMASSLHFSGSGISVKSATGVGPVIVATISIAEDADIGARTVWIDNVAGTLTFTVHGADTSVLTSLSPSTGGQGQTLDVEIYGDNLSQGINASQIHFTGEGIAVNSVSQSQQSVIVNITIASTAEEGIRDVTIDGIEGKLSFAILSIDTKKAMLLKLDRTSGLQGQTCDVKIFGENVNWGQGTVSTSAVQFAAGISSSSISFGSGITLNSATANGNVIKVNISIDSSAVPGDRPVSVTNTEGSLSFTVVAASTPVLTAINPVNGEIGKSCDLEIGGANVSWSGNMISSLHFSGSGITVNSATGNGTTISTNISIASDATLGARTVTVDGASGSLSFTITQTSTALEPDQVTFSPSSQANPATLTLEIPSASGTGTLIISTPPPQTEAVATIPITYEPGKTIITADLLNQVTDKKLSGPHLITLIHDGKVVWQKAILFK